MRGASRGRDGRVRMWNPSAERMFGWKEAEVLGIYPPIVPEHLRDEAEAMRLKAEAGETLWIEETQRAARDGRLMDVSMTVAPILGADDEVDGTIVTIADISPRKQAEAALRKSEAQLRLAMEAAQLAVWYWEGDTDEFTYSDGMNVLFGRPREAPRTGYRELRDHGIHVVNVKPALTDTEFGHVSRGRTGPAGGDPPEKVARWICDALESGSATVGYR